MKACLDDIGIVLRAAGMDYLDVASAQVFLTDVTQFKRMNAVYASVFKAPRPGLLTNPEGSSGYPLYGDYDAYTPEISDWFMRASAGFDHT